MIATVLVGAVLGAVIVLAFVTDVLAARGPVSRSGSRRYDRVYEQSRRRASRG
jgi:hypothetical protein